MNENIFKFADIEENILNYEVADEAVEAAAGILEGQAKNATISFCSGLDTKTSLHAFLHSGGSACYLTLRLDHQTRGERASTMTAA